MWTPACLPAYQKTFELWGDWKEVTHLHLLLLEHFICGRALKLEQAFVNTDIFIFYKKHIFKQSRLKKCFYHDSVFANHKKVYKNRWIYRFSTATVIKLAVRGMELAECWTSMLTANWILKNRVAHTCRVTSKSVRQQTHHQKTSEMPQHWTWVDCSSVDAHFLTIHPNERQQQQFRSK